MNINIIRAILIIMLLGIFSTIFGFSSQDGETSGSLSREITVNVTKNIKSIQKLEPSEKEKILKKIEQIIRKGAHFSLYTVVGILLMGLMSTYKISKIKRFGISAFIGAIYAITDEIHQAFTPDRTPYVTDVLIDSAGVIFGIFLIYVMIETIKKLKNVYIKSDKNT